LTITFLFVEGLDRSTGVELGKAIRRGDARTPADDAVADVVDDGGDMLD